MTRMIILQVSLCVCFQFFACSHPMQIWRVAENHETRLLQLESECLPIDDIQPGTKSRLFVKLSGISLGEHKPFYLITFHYLDYNWVGFKGAVLVIDGETHIFRKKYPTNRSTATPNHCHEMLTIELTTAAFRRLVDAESLYIYLVGEKKQFEFAATDLIERFGEFCYALTVGSVETN